MKEKTINSKRTSPTPSEFPNSFIQAGRLIALGEGAGKMKDDAKWKTVKIYYPACRYAGTKQERNAQFRGPNGGLYDVRFVMRTNPKKRSEKEPEK